MKTSIGGPEMGLSQIRHTSVIVRNVLGVGAAKYAILSQKLLRAPLGWRLV